ncbi:MAG TPA: FAD/NAD(P)-binding protein [Steroidobacteraceae bacterium]|jgi:uncharacterized NAD(P)/FAD-binding protein YdhS|nr:FAD/NAD(P)-binding protein [Steroidobacteraceae bacterium]
MATAATKQLSQRTIAIIGGGFCGCALAAALLRHPPAAPTRIILIERRRSVGCGVAYASGPFPYVLNVPAARMPPLCDDPSQLVRFAQSRVPGAGAQSFLPRALYGDYLRDALRTAELTAPPHVRLERVHGEATEVRHGQQGTALLVRVGGRQEAMDHVVLACGDPPPVARAYAADVPGHPAYVRDPHQQDFIRPSDRAVLLVGTGLTMIDVAVAIAERNPDAHIIALSRHGLLPNVQREAWAPVLERSFDVRARLATTSMRVLVAGVRALCSTVQRRGGDWREAIGRVRELAPLLWRELDEVQRRRFLRHVRVYWDVHRHRMPHAVAEKIDDLRRSGRLQLRAGCIRQLCADGERLVALWRPRGHFEIREAWVDRVIECSGADHRIDETADVLLRNLLDGGLASVDPTGLGLRTGKLGALLGADGRAAGRLFYLGPMLRAASWEATAAVELDARARELAAALAGGASSAVHPFAVHSPVCYTAATDAVTSAI